MHERLSRYFFCFMVLVLVAVPHFPGGTPDAAAREPRPETWAQPVELKHSRNFFRVSGDVYRSAQPDEDGMRACEQFGIRTVVNLRARHSDTDEARGTNLVLVHIPTKTRAVSSDETVIAALRAIRNAEKPVLVHCMHGADRTGLVIAMYRIIEQDWTREEALDELRNGGFGFHSIWKHIPEYLENLDDARIERIRTSLR